MLNASEITGRANSPQFKPVFNNLRPYTQMVHTDCVEREVLFSDEIPKHRAMPTYKEWTISCSVTTRQDTTETFIVSRGYELNSIFVFLPLEHGMAVNTHCSNVSVVDDYVSNRDET